MTRDDAATTGAVSDVTELSMGAREEAAVARMRVLARLLDDSIRVPGTNFRIGLDPILGVVPGSGDAVSAALSLYIVAESARLGVTPATLLRMLANVGIDVAGGGVPVVGGVFDAAWKANRKNVDLAVDELAVDPTTRVDVPIDVE